jgi:glycosyltransferase involved in cell wall biosynthesis
MFTYRFWKILRFLQLISKEKYKLETAKYTKEYKLIARSNLFDAKWYKKSILNSEEKKIDPIFHYLQVGWKKGLYPCKDFNVYMQLLEHFNIKELDINPLIFYEQYKRKLKKQSTVRNKIADCFSQILYKINQKNPYPSLCGNNNVLLLSHELSRTGAPLALLNLARILKKNNFNPVVLSPLDGPLERELEENGIKYIIEKRILYKLIYKNKPFLDYLNNFSVIFFNTICTIDYAEYIPSHIRKICWVHEGAEGYRSVSTQYSIKRAFSFIDEVYSVGHYSKSYTDKYISDFKSRILLYGIENISNTFSNNTSTDKMTFGLFGVCSARKGTDIFIQAIKDLPFDIKNNCLFKIVGSCANKEFCENLKKLSQNENIIFSGELPHINTLNEMKSCDVIVCPSLDDPMPIVCTEAMMLNKPIICSNRTGTSSFIQNGKNGFLCDINADNLANIIKNVYLNKANLPEIGKRWHQVYLDNFTFDIFEKNVMQIFNS